MHSSLSLPNSSCYLQISQPFLAANLSLIFHWISLMSTPLEHDYIGLTEISSSMEKSSDHKLSSSYSSSISSTLFTETDKTSTLNLKQTELRLGLPGSESPERKPGFGVSLFGKDLEEKHNGYPISPLKKLVSGSKRGFLDTIDGSCGKWVFSGSNGSEVDSGKACVSKPVIKEVSGGVSQAPKPVQEKKNQISGVNIEHGNIAAAAKAQVVGWPPIRSFRKNNMTSNLAKNNDELGSGCLYVKVSMDGAPYLRKVDLKTCNNYSELSSALEKMFSCFSIGQCGSHGLPGRDGLSESHLMDLLHGSEYLLSYEDRDGDWMLLGDVPWEMFTDSCRRLRIMKGSEAIGLAPRAMEKCKNRN